MLYELVNVVIQRHGEKAWTGLARVDGRQFESTVESDLDIHSPRLSAEVGDPIKQTLRNKLAVDFPDQDFEFFVGYHETCFGTQ